MPKFIREGEEGKIDRPLTPEEEEQLQHIRKREEIEAEAKLWDPEREAHERKGDYHKTQICFNSACPDYRVERTDGSSCACKRTSIQGAGTNV